MTEPATPENPAPRPVPDLGFFAGASAGAGAPFGGAPAVSPLRAGPTGNQFGTAPAANQFGGPPTVTHFVTPTHHAARATPVGRSISPTTKVVAGVLGLVLLVGSVLGGRFAWRHFAADPVLPDTLMSLPRVTDPATEAELQATQESMASELAVGSEAKVAFYTDGMGQGAMLFALRGSSRPGQDGREATTTGWAESKHGTIQCFQKPAQVQTGVGVTFCVRGFFRRAVVVMAFGLTPPDPVMVARGAEEAWQAQ